MSSAAFCACMQHQLNMITGCMQIAAAYEVLSDDKKKSVYDQVRAGCISQCLRLSSLAIALPPWGCLLLSLVCAVPSLTSWLCLLQYGEQGLQADAGGGPGGPGGPGGMNFGEPGGATFSFQASGRPPPNQRSHAGHAAATDGGCSMAASAAGLMFAWQAARTLQGSAV